MTADEVVELKPCPFCGSELLDTKSCYVHCQSCGTDGPVFDDWAEDCDYLAETTALWNTRNSSPSFNTGVEEMLNRIEFLLTDPARSYSENIGRARGFMAEILLAGKLAALSDQSPSHGDGDGN